MWCEARTPARHPMFPTTWAVATQQEKRERGDRHRPEEEEGRSEGEPDGRIRASHRPLLSVSSCSPRRRMGRGEHGGRRSPPLPQINGGRRRGDEEGGSLIRRCSPR
ncbi:hypothetical protein PR202_ga22706 [Eleusine coracana subsp. coracana]|uniref:Uncharacterized protein n=1 Tax=Eleusine coracana subsp. coracana TaxID=191504 RepID=A0AAV5D4B3_ELECO|nr:hypothetical protein PR202_ga22706 [Eleusine coracana subsp. coracana]